MQCPKQGQSERLKIALINFQQDFAKRTCYPLLPTRGLYTEIVNNCKKKNGVVTPDYDAAWFCRICRKGPVRDPDWMLAGLLHLYTGT